MENRSVPLHILRPGQQLLLRWREARKDHAHVFNLLRQMKLTPDDNGNPYADAFCTHVSEEGISVYITRGYTYGGDIQGFVPKTICMWQSYFEPTTGMNASYAKRTHASKVFPLDFIDQHR